ncbi:MAG: FAD-linked oxidase C-terminal domain-containing protein [Candidatus Gastranaerophilales bacterium]
MLTKDKFIFELTQIFSQENIQTSLDDRIYYSKDAGHYKGERKLPDAVVFAETIEQVQQVVKLANIYNVPIICRGAGTNVVGSCVAVNGGIILNFSKMNKVLELNRENMSVRVQSGVVVGDLQNLVESVGLYFPPDPSNLAISTIGGGIAQASSGARTFKYGSIKDYIIDLLVVTADGEILRTGSNTIKNATGYNLGSLFVGSEGTLGIITEATLKLICKPECQKVMLAYFDNLENSIKAVSSIIEHKITPATIDFMDKNALAISKKYVSCDILETKEAALIIEIDGFEITMDYQQQIIEKILNSAGATKILTSKNKQEYEQIWQARRSSMTACKMIKSSVITDDVIVPRENLAKLVTGVRVICEKYKLEVCMVGHVGDGSVHPQIPIDLDNEEEYKNLKNAKNEIYELTAKLDGLISGEHGVGLDKKEHIHKVINPIAIDYMRQIKKTFDPNNILNPYKIF